MTATLPGAATATRSLETIRADFPALARREGAHRVAYFDGPGGTQVPTVVAEAVTDYLLHHNANTHWAYPTSTESDAITTPFLTTTAPTGTSPAAAAKRACASARAIQAASSNMAYAGPGSA